VDLQRVIFGLLFCASCAVGQVRGDTARDGPQGIDDEFDKPFRRVANINAERMYSHGHRLWDLVVGKPGPDGSRTIGSAWVVSNCTSNWNGENFRVDRVKHTTLIPIANQAISAFLGDPVKITLGGSAVTVQYSTQDGGTNLIPAAERYRIDGDHLIRLAEPPR
jgi:hypothetical protein